MSSSPAISRIEWVFVLVATVLGLGLRVWHLDRLAVEHFDEGVYASNLYFTERDNFRYPNQHLYAPPLVPSLIEWSMTFLGDDLWVPMVPGIILGAATVPLLWWMMRRLTGPMEAMLACWLLATNEYHIFYSRTALTEPVLGFFWVLALGMGARALLLPMTASMQAVLIQSSLAGVACGLCWWTKYNGWLTAFLICATAGLQWLLLERTKTRLVRNLVVVGTVVGVTVLVYSPSVWSLQETGGYLAVSANHRQYFKGLGSWWKNFEIQTEHLRVLQHYMTGGLGALSVFGIIYWLRNQADISDETQEARPSDRKCLESNWILGCVYVVIFFSSASVVVCVVISSFLIYECYSSRSLIMKDSMLGLSVLVSALWMTLLVVLTPLYYPYPRLLMPAMIGSIVAYSLTIELLGRKSLEWWKANRDEKRLKQVEANRPVIRFFNAMLVVTGLLGALGLGTRIYAPRTGLAKSVSEVVKAVRPDGNLEAPLIVYVYGEPAAYWHLSQQRVLAGPVSNLDFANPEARQKGIELYLVTGPHAGQTPVFGEQMEAKKEFFEEVGRYQFKPSLLVTMDEVEGLKEEVEELVLWRVK